MCIFVYWYERRNWNMKFDIPLVLIDWWWCFDKHSSFLLSDSLFR